MAKSIKSLSAFGCRSFRSQLKQVVRGDLFNLICNQIGIKNKPDKIPERWIKKLLLEQGEFVIFNGMICEVAGNSGLFVYDEPTQLMIMSPSHNTSMLVPREKCVWVGANQTRSGIMGYLDLQCNKLVELEISFVQNVIASRSGDIIGVDDENTILSIKNAMLQNCDGTPIIVTNKKLIEGENLVQIKLSTQFVADKLNQLKQEIYNETLQHFGIMNANSNKAERVQVGEMEVSSTCAEDSIYMIIETANRDLEAGGIGDDGIRFYFNGALNDFVSGSGETDNGANQGDDEEE